ncbi:hypothetical protein GDO78_002435 [Eleutherodactylus coqui]|uniref:Uncharacterized protein n=1 Tax=Eleutherodactylus coqui TaxID=57060 RepID=A0A8J6EY86_ELECQ|nr:hypothetical protein GDO78_002435 [Eleutherodactylus coqui]
MPRGLLPDEPYFLISVPVLSDVFPSAVLSDWDDFLLLNLELYESPLFSFLEVSSFPSFVCGNSSFSEDTTQVGFWSCRGLDVVGLHLTFFI